ncbi:hypothetical protein B0H13DRAFT_2343497 [Mycena leptocephala]|nr:hypothetical protein B0H13DRAFT_2343497 [Mycena leptocephala]
MSTPLRDNTGRGSERENWRSSPPHQSLGMPPDNGEFVTTPTGIDNLHAPDPAAGPTSSATSGERTESPGALSGLTAHVSVDPHGRRYFQESSTGLRIEVFDSRGEAIPASPAQRPVSPLAGLDSQPPSTTVSEASDLTPGSAAERPADDTSPRTLISVLLDGLNPSALSLNQRGTLQSVHRHLATSRQRLLNTTAIVLDQRKSNQENRASLAQFRTDTAARFLELGDVLDTDHLTLERCVQDNVELLSELGESEATLTRILTLLGATSSRSAIPRPVIPEISTPDITQLTDDLMQDVDHALPPRRPGETEEEFSRRALFSASSKRCAAAAFPLAAPMNPDGRSGAHPFKAARFEDPGSISSILRPCPTTFENISAVGGPGFGPSISGVTSTPIAGKNTLEALEEFNTEAENVIRSIIFRAVGEELSDFSGLNNHTVFLEWLEEVTTWMRASFMGGTGSADHYRITVLKTLLSSSAHQWFIDYVESRNRPSEIPYDFASIICTLHRRFVTAATAQKATREFDAVRYNADEGPLKLMDGLVDASNRMREPMPEFIIRQRFMKSLPENITGVMAVHRVLSAEYSSAADLHYHANQLWDAYHHSGRNHKSPTAPAVIPPRNSNPPRRDHARVTTSAPGVAIKTPVSVLRPPNHSSSTAHNANSGTNSSRRCWKCGGSGHIASDPICPKHGEPMPPRVVAAQRVIDSYAEGDFAAGEEQEVDDDWGGSQYGPDHEEAIPADTDAEDLIDLSEGDAPRLGAMHLHGYSMRIEPTSPSVTESSIAISDDKVVVAQATLTPMQVLLNSVAGSRTPLEERTVNSLYGVCALFDIGRLQDHQEFNGEPPYSEDEVAHMRRELELEHEYPISEYSTHEDLVYRFHLLNEGANLDNHLEEQAILTQLGESEEC